MAPAHLRGFSPPFLSAVPEPGGIQVWTGLLIESAENWSVLVRPPANLPRSLAFDLYEGIVETDRWFGPLFTNLRLVKTDVPIHFSTETPLVQVQPLHRSTYADEVSNGFAVVGRPARVSRAKRGQRYEQTIVKPNVEPRAGRRLCHRGPAPAQERLPGARRMNGYWAAAIAVLIWASYPVATRAGVTGSFTAQELVTLRFGVGALLFLPYLLLQFRTIRRGAWLQGVPLTLCQGVAMGALVICGLQLAPANHAAALGPGVNPAWVALLGFVVFARRPSPRVIVGATLCAMGVLALAWWSTAERNAAVLLGDAMFLAASALGALYVLQLRTWGVGAIQGAAIVSLYSALVVVPWYLWSAPAPLMARLPARAGLAGTLAGRADRLRRAHRAQPRHSQARRRALERAERVGAGAERSPGARVPRGSPFADRDRGIPRDLRRRLDRRLARLRRQSGVHQRANETPGLRAIAPGIACAQRGSRQRRLELP